MSTTAARHAFVTDVPDLSTFAFPDGGPDDATELAPPTSRIQVAKVGSFKNPRYGAFTVTKGTFDSFIANLAANVCGDQLPGDFDHEPDMGGSTAACGWLTALEVDGNSLFGTVEWNWDGAWAIHEKRYRWISPTWNLNYTDDAGTKHGPTMIGFALTNRPFFSRMAAISLSASFSAMFSGLPDQTVEQVEQVAAPPRLDRVFAAALDRIDPSLQSIVEGAYARDPRHGMYVLEALLTRAG